ncbi:lytic transglycosylase domain-containing protein [Yinghuangia aomiensis]
MPAAYQPAIERWGRHVARRSRRRCWPRSCTRRAGSTRGRSSPVGAQGIAQFMPGTWPQWATDGNGDGRRDPFDAEDAIPSAARYDCALAKSIATMPGDRTDNMLAAQRGSYRVIQYKGVPPYAETRSYVKNIRSLEQSFGAVKAPIPPSVLAVGAIPSSPRRSLGTPYLWGGEGTVADGGRRSIARV